MDPRSSIRSMTQTKEWDTRELNLLRSRAIRWYRREARALPWRQTSDPYQIWVSEIMLQQTQVATVIPFFHRFLASFPTVSALAAADEQDVLFHWSGLGYYRRARQLHAAAKLIDAQWQGQFPTSFESIQSLPGVGRYTAGAIASFAFDDRRPIVEANTQRLYARLLRLRGQLSELRQQSMLWEFAEELLPSRGGSGEINQALMEIGSQVCLPSQPRCEECPLAELCPTFANDEQALIPTPKPPKVYENRVEAAVMVYDAKKGYLMRQCGSKERWAGLWDFPRFDVTHCKTKSELLLSVVDQCLTNCSIPIAIEQDGFVLKHGVTRYRITLHVFHAGIAGKPKKRLPALAWHPLPSLKMLPLSSTGVQILKRLT